MWCGPHRRTGALGLQASLLLLLLPLAPLAGQPGFSGCLLRQDEGEEGPSLLMFVPSLEPSSQRPGSRAGGSGDGR